MAIEFEKHNLRSYELKQQIHRRNRRLVIAVGAILAVLIISISIYFVINKSYAGFEVIHSIERSDSSSAKYLSYKSGVLRYSRDGAVAMDSGGNQLWNGTYQMSNPMVDISGNFVAISDRGYKTVQIFDGEGGMNTVEVQHPIIMTKIANQGVIAVLMKGNEANYISLYDKNGVNLINSRTIAGKDGFPIDIDLSEDGRKLVTSYVSLSSGSLQSNVTFYNFGVGQNYIDRIVGAFPYGQTLIADVEFLGNDTVAAFGDNKYCLYSMKELPDLIQEEEITGEIKSILHNNKYFGFVVPGAKDQELSQIMLFDLGGKKILDKKLDYEYENIYLSGDEIIMHSGQDWMIWRINGKEKIQGTFDNLVSYILPSKGNNKYIIINGTNMQEVSLTD
ncbi:MAG: hypothetical protein K0R92_2222 [Lachnospiraceae bacterium]|jgi:hypothetical protein|nr:hypothetical protein [Lachnospiraceae bacterium]